MQKIYDAKMIEKPLSSVHATRTGPSYTIMLPPPNITGSLHMGHAFQQTLMDVLIRYHDMQGYNTLFQGGTDHAGIATQMVVERLLNAEGINRLDLGRALFVDKIWDWYRKSNRIIQEQIQGLGISIDWNRAHFTLDETLSHATYTAFLRLYEEGLIYKGQRMIYWDPHLRTAVSDLEVDVQETEGHLWYIRYPLVCDTNCCVVVATTRPETLLADAAVAVHPEDARYRAYIGTHVHLPLTQRQIPIIADVRVDPNFGTGCLKITPGHDFQDYEIGKDHDLSITSLFTETACLTDEAPETYRGLDRFVVRKRIVEDLEAAHLLEKTESYRVRLPKGDRSGVVLEPRLTHQWFVRMKSLAQPALDAVRSGSLTFVPETWTKVYVNWLENIEDWCISRQLWWGHRLPIWYDPQGLAYAGCDEQEVRKKNHLDRDLPLVQDPDVLDTWFSASLWPFAALGWPLDTADFRMFFPTEVLITGFDIIFFWVARMVMMSLKLTQQLPFKKVYITGLIRDQEGHKMSKTKGNVLDPMDLIHGISLNDLIKKRTTGLMQPHIKKSIETDTKKQFPNGMDAHGTDALRFTFCALATHGRDIYFDMQRLKGYHHFCNKLWNAARFVVSYDKETHCAKDTDCMHPIDHWIRQRLNQVIEAVHHNFCMYRFDCVAQVLYDFVWHEYCDWYLEWAKCHLNGRDADQCRITYLTLVDVLRSALQLLHPIMPWITQEIWPHLVTTQDRSIGATSYPQRAHHLDTTHQSDIEWLQLFTTTIRTVRSKMRINPNQHIVVVLRLGDADDIRRLQNFDVYYRSLAKIKEVRYITREEHPPLSATALVRALEIYIPWHDQGDWVQEIKRLDRALCQLNQDIETMRKRLDEPRYVHKAPPHVVEAECKKLRDCEKMRHTLQEQRLYFQKEELNQTEHSKNDETS